MRKLSLSLEDLQVESFATSAPARRTGTVKGNEWSLGDDACSGTGCVVTDAAGGCTVFWCGPAQSENSCKNTCGDGSDCTEGVTLWDGCTNNYKLCG